MSIYTLACPTVGCYQNFNCDPEFLNKVVAVAFIKKTYAGEIDKTTAESWMNTSLQYILRAMDEDASVDSRNNIAYLI